MKRALFSLILWTVVFSLTLCSLTLAKEERVTTPTDVTQTDTNQSVWAKTVAEALSPLKGKCEIWIPILTQGYEITDITITPNGSYLFSVKTDKSEERKINRIAVIRNAPQAKPQDRLCFYVHTLGESAFPITPKSAELLPKELSKMEDQKYKYYFKPLLAQYGTAFQRPALVAVYESESNPIGVDGHGMLSYFTETVVQLNDKQLLAVWHTADSILNSDSPIILTTFGDGNMDSFVNAKDALLVLKHSVQKAKIDDANAFYLCDFNQDQILNAQDALSILKKAVGK